MKRFAYFRIDEGGMYADLNIHTAEDLRLYGWMHKTTKNRDEKLVKWMETADIGDHFEHRLGVMVRLKDTKGGVI